MPSSPPSARTTAEANGLLDVGDGNLVYWEVGGNPAGRPIVNVHGGPGSGTSATVRQGFDPAVFRVVTYDQRGCGRSLPNAADPATDMTVNTTAHLVADLEQLRDHLQIDRWLLHGGSWGSTLILAYAEQHPDRVAGILLLGVTMTRRVDIAWLYHGVGRFFPGEWERFVGAVPEASAPPSVEDGDIQPVLAAYAARMDDPDPGVRARAAADWVAWEDAVISLESHGRPGAYSARVEAAREAMVRICSRYFANAAWLEEDTLLRNAPRLDGVPGFLLHGRSDLGGPVHVAHELAKAWPGSQLTIIEDSGHTGSAGMRSRRDEALRQLSQP